MHCSVLAEEALKKALQDYYDKNGIAYDASQFPDEDHDPHEHEHGHDHGGACCCG